MNSESAINVWTERPRWFGKINIEEYEKLASIGYTPQQIAMYYDIDVGDFMFYFTLLRSPLKYHYDRGQLLQQAKEGISMTDAAATGENVTKRNAWTSSVGNWSSRTILIKYFSEI